MEENLILNNQQVSIKGSELLKKFKSSEDRFNFICEMSKY